MLPSEEEIKGLLLKYIAGETNDQEAALVEKWLRDHPEAFQEFEQLWDLWYAVGTATNVFRFNVDEGWNETLLKIRASKLAHKRKNSLKKIIIWVSSIAAACLLFLGISLWRSPRNSPHILTRLASHLPVGLLKENTDTIVTRYDTKIQTPPGSKREIKLPDGSTVWLSGSTAIHFRMNEKQRVRTLFLSGQAFFNIKDKANMPFVVKTKHATIKVLGTRFNVSAYPQDSIIQATLTSGRIVFETIRDHLKVERQIHPGQQVAINYLSGRLEVSDVDTVFYTSWKEGKIIFNNQEFNEVTKAMEHKYNVDIIFEDRSLIHKRLNGYLQKESLTEAMTALKLTLKFHYKIEGNKVFIYQ